MINLEAIKARHAASTKGPYRWRWPSGSNAPELIAPHSGMLLVMDAVRKGMTGAVVRFAERIGNQGGLMCKLSDLCEQPHYRASEYLEIGNPDANAIAHSWQDREDLIAEVERLRGELASRNRGTPIDEAIDRMKPGASDSVVDMLRAACDAFGGD